MGENLARKFSLTKLNPDPIGRVADPLSFDPDLDPAF